MSWVRVPSAPPVFRGRCCVFYAFVLNCRTVEENSLVEVYSSIWGSGSARLLGNRPSAAHPTPGGRRGRFLPKKATNHQTNGPRFLCAALQDMPAAAPIPSPPRAVRSHGRPRIWRPDCTGAWRMPWRWQAKKDAASCDKPRGDACGLRSGGFRMGQPGILQDAAPA